MLSGNQDRPLIQKRVENIYLIGQGPTGLYSIILLTAKL